MQKTLTPHFMMLAPRGITAKEADKLTQSFKEKGNIKVKAEGDASCFTDMQDVVETSKGLKNKVQTIFSERLEELEQLFNEREMQDIYRDKQRRVSLVNDDDDIIRDDEPMDEEALITNKKTKKLK